jgi:hypothetical protein
MSDQNPLSRRDFLRTAGAVGAGALLSGSRVFAQGSPAAAATQPAAGDALTVPTRPFGKTGMNVSMLSLGGIFDILRNQLVLKQAYKWGITYWDTANSYQDGNSEMGIGMYLEANPEHRKNLCLVTKTSVRDSAGISQELQTSLERLKTDYIDMYFIHGVRSPKELTQYSQEWKTWVEKAKAEKKIRFFGFSTHSNMEENLQAASSLGFIDGIMLTYNFRIMDTDKMKSAVDACAKAGIGLTAMKTQGAKSRRAASQPAGAEEAELAMVERFAKRGFNDHQARLKAIWENPNIASICSQMPNLGILQSNYQAAVDKTALSRTDKELLRQYAAVTCSSYCAGCGNTCQAASGGLPVADVMRFLMYHNDYGLADHARRLFAELPGTVRRQLTKADFSLAQRHCPQGLAIAEMMREAVETLA